MAKVESRLGGAGWGLANSGGVKGGGDAAGGMDGSGHGGMEVVAGGAEAHGPPADRRAGQVGTETM